MSRTAASSTYPTRAIVLRVRPLGEKDRVLTLLSPEHGKLSAVARGARGTKSKLAAISQPFIHARFLIARGRSLDIVTQAEIEHAHSHLGLDLPKTAWATYLCELCDAVPEQMPDGDLFMLLAIALQALDMAPAGSHEVELTGRWFEARYLALLGYAPTIGRCVSCAIKIAVPAADATQRIAFSPTQGGTLCPRCGAHDPYVLTLSVQALRALYRLERADLPLTFGQLSLSLAAARDLRDCLRACLQAHLDLKLKSRSFLDDVTAAQPPPQNDV